MAASDNVTLHRLMSVPVVGSLDRLYVDTSDDTLKIDQCHAYVGCVGRTIIGSWWSTTHNRTVVVATIRRLVQETRILASRCVARLDSPYVRKNLECFSTESSGTKHYRHCLSVIEKHIPRIETMLIALQATYQGDETIQTALSESIDMVRETVHLLVPVKFLLI